MKKMPTSAQPRHGVRAPGRTLLTITLSAELKARLVAAAAEEERTVSNLVAHRLGRLFKKGGAA